MSQLETILFVCTANLCRSPMAEALFRSAMAELGCGIGVSSAGFLRAGLTPPKQVLRAMSQVGGGLSDHMSNLVETAVEPQPDLILTMAAEHVRKLKSMDPALGPRTFTLKEFIRLAEIEGPRLPDETLTDYAARVGGDRFVAYSASDDVEDPIGKRNSAYLRCAAELTELVARLVALVCAGRPLASPTTTLRK